MSPGGQTHPADNPLTATTESLNVAHNSWDIVGTQQVFPNFLAFASYPDHAGL